MSHLSVPRGGRLRALAAAGTAAAVFGLSGSPAAEADTTTLQGTVGAGALSVAAPTVSPFEATLAGTTQTVHTKVGAWSVTDARGSGEGYSVTLSASAPTISGSDASSPTAGTGFALQLTPSTATAASGNPTPTGPVASPDVSLSTSAQTIENAAPNTGQGEWNFPADTGAGSLAVTIPADASDGSYSSTLTFTTAAPVGSGAAPWQGPQSGGASHDFT